MTEIPCTDLHGSVADPAMLSMNFLNEIAGRFPDAISFAAGRPYEEFYDVDLLPRYLKVYRDHLVAERGYTEDQVRRTIFQYGRTNGVIGDLLARYLATDEGIEADPASIVVTVGAQEALFLVLRALRATERDAVMAIAPTYVGLLGAARLLDMPTIAVRDGEDGIDLADCAARVRAARDSGLVPRALYLVPDNANPSGASLPEHTRRDLLDLAEREDFLILEDNPYGMFSGDAAQPPMKALDTLGRVVYLGSLSKTCFPGARIGFAVADQRVTGPAGTTLLADELSKIKSMLTVNTPAIAQAVIGGRLLEHGCSLRAANQRETAVYQRNLRLMLDGLTARFGPDPDITWNTPRGGFFIGVDVPFAAGDDLLERSAREFGVLWTPMHHFYGGADSVRQLRLSFSVVSPEQIDTGLDRLAALIASQR